MEEKENSVVYNTDDGKGLFVPERNGDLKDIHDSLDKIYKNLAKIESKLDDILSEDECNAGDE